MCLIDGNDFTPYFIYNENTDVVDYMRHDTFESGDNRFCAIAAASILAKSERDAYITGLCDKHPILKERYSIDKNMGYGTKKHMTGIAEHGIVDGHRRTFGICKTAEYSNILDVKPTIF